MAAAQVFAPQLETIDEFPAGLGLSNAFNRQAGAPAALVQLFASGGAPEPNDFNAQKGGVLWQLHAQRLLEESIGKEHQLLGQPFQIAVAG